MKRNIIIAFILSAFSLFFAKSTSAQTAIQVNSQKFATLLYLIDNYYVDSTSCDSVTEKAIVAMLKELDPHSAYISKNDVAKANEPLVGSFEGIGVTFQLIRDTITVISPTAGGPSEKVGIMAGDKFIKIDGEDSFGKKVDNEYVQNHLRGKKGTKVTVSVKRGDDPELIDFEITRDKIPLNSINAYFMLDDKTGYIKLDRFAQESGNEFRDAVAILKKEGMKSLVFDLRGNTGGYLNTAIEIVDELLDNDKLIVYTEGLKAPRQEWRSNKKGCFTKGHLIVLIDEGSASASEITSGAVQDHDRGIVIGRRSFGKGLVQRPFNLPDGAQVRLTTARYHTPTGRCIQRPYEQGSEDYYKELTKRMERGEYFHADSIQFPDSLKYKTDNGRTVYGGGGIMPDIFISADTTYSSKLYTNLVRKGIINRFTADYTIKNRANIEQSHKNFESFEQNFDIDDDMIGQLKEAAEKSKIEWKDDEYARSESFIKLQVKAMIARDLYGQAYYYRVTVKEDKGVKTALELIDDNKRYKETLAGE